MSGFSSGSSNSSSRARGASGRAGHRGRGRGWQSQRGTARAGGPGGPRTRQQAGDDDATTAAAEAAAARRQRFAQLDASSQNDYGLVSRGEEQRLQRDPKAREEYFRAIEQAFADYCTTAEDRELFKEELKSSAGNGSGVLAPECGSKRDIDWVFMSLRKSCV